MLTPSSSAFPAPIALFTTTRGATPAQKGWLSAFRLDREGRVIAIRTSPPQDQTPLHDTTDTTEDIVALRLETPTSSGKANALDIRSKHDGTSDGFWILLTDDDRAADEVGAVRVLEWDGWGPSSDGAGLRVVAEWPAGGQAEGELEEKEEESTFTGASHAIWLD